MLKRPYREDEQAIAGRESVIRKGRKTSATKKHIEQRIAVALWIYFEFLSLDLTMIYAHLTDGAFIYQGQPF